MDQAACNALSAVHFRPAVVEAIGEVISDAGEDVGKPGRGSTSLGFAVWLCV
jgi:hypothetical protein